MGRFDDITAPQTTGRFDSVGRGRFDDIAVKEPSKSIGRTIGGAFGTLGNVLSVGQRAVTGSVEFGLEKTGVLKETGASPLKAIRSKESNIDLLRRIGKETGRGGVLTGQYTPTTSVFGNFIRELPVASLGTLGDIYADPLFVLGKTGAIAKTTKTIGKGIKAGFTKVADEVPAVQKVGNMLGKAFVTRYGQRGAFQELDVTRKIEESLAQEKVGRIVSDVIEKPQVIQQRITQFIKGDTKAITQSIDDVDTKLMTKFIDEIRLNRGKDRDLILQADKLRERLGIDHSLTNLKLADTFDDILQRFKKGELFFKKAAKTELPITDSELQALADPIRKEFDRVGKSISELNPKLLDPMTFEANKGAYFPRLYTDKEFPDVEGAVKGIFSSRAVNIPKEPFKARILTEAESLAKGTRIEEAGFPALKRLTQLNIAEKRQKFFSEVAKLASSEAKPDWVQLSDDKALGDLAGKFLPTAEYNAIAQLRKIPSEAERMYNKGLALWKTFKTAYNPSTIARNDITNYFILNPLGGVGPHRLDIYARTTNELLTNGPLFQMARKQGLNISTQEAAELTQKATRFYRENQSLVGKFFSKVEDFHNVVKNFYGSQDKYFKLANFIKGVTEDGMTPFEAMRRANFYLVDYSEVPQLVEWLRKSPVGIPFISFTYGVSKPLAKTLLERPDQLSAYYKILNGIQSLNPLGETPKELEEEKGVLPDWISHGTFLRLPTKDKIGRSQYVDLQYILPTNILETNNITPSSPVLSWTAALITNKDPFFQKEIWNDTDTDLEKAQKAASYLLRQFVPSLTPFVGTSFNKIKNYFQKRPDRSGFVKETGQVLLDILGGIKITPIDPTIEAQKRARERQKVIEELRSQLRIIMLDKSLFPEEKERQAKEVREKLEKAVQ